MFRPHADMASVTVSFFSLRTLFHVRPEPYKVWGVWLGLWGGLRSRFIPMRKIPDPSRPASTVSVVLGPVWFWFGFWRLLVFFPRRRTLNVSQPAFFRQTTFRSQFALNS